MKVWLVTVGEPIPPDRAPDRLMRAGILAKTLVAKGNEVLWWTSTFNHTTKTHRFSKDTELIIEDGYRIRLLKSTGYRRNISISRLVDHWHIAKKFKKQAGREAPPDVILCSLPTLELCEEATVYGRQHGVPVVLDIRDLWPDIFVEVAPRWAQLPAKAMLAPYYRTTRSACARADALIGNAPAFVDWGLKYAGRGRTALDKDFPFGYTAVPPSEDAVASGQSFWADHGIREGAGDFVVCFFGTIGRQFELDAVIDAARLLEGSDTRVKVVLCGNGDRLDYYKERARSCASVLFPGWVDVAQIWTLMRMSSAGLAPYRDCDNFTMNLPNKPIEYLSAGLPVISSLSKGYLNDLLAEHDCGTTYVVDDPHSLAQTLACLARDPARCTRMGENAHRLFTERFIAERVYDAMCRHLEEVAAGGTSLPTGAAARDLQRV
jgi:glycosyltransferase involved in cell wall biosynthesis